MDKEELKQNYASIHTLLMEGDYDKMLRLDKYTVISIHTLRMEGDPGCSVTATGATDFNPHPPRGG